MRKLFFLVVAFAPLVHAATNVTLTVQLQQPMPHSFAVWQRNDRNLVVVTIQNFDPIVYSNIRLSVIVRDVDNNKIVAHTNDNDPGMPRFTIPASPVVGAPGILILRGRDCINSNAITIDAQVKSQAIATNSLPEGNFEFCAKLIKNDNTDLTASGSDCPQFGVVLADPPVLIAPEDKALLPAQALPIFTWAQVAPVPPGTMVTYWLTIVPVFEKQMPRDAIEHNEVVFRSGMPVTTYQYLPSDRPFGAITGATGFAWQIEALDETGQPITNNQGKSDIHTFRFDTLHVLTPPPPPPPPPPDRSVSGGRK